MAKKYTASLTLTPRQVNATSPIDDRFVVTTESDLYSRSTFKVGTTYYTYVGMFVVTADTGDMYVLTKRPSSANSTSDAKYSAAIEWKKIGGSDFNAEDYRSYYAEQLGARFVSSVDELDDLTFKFDGMFAVVTGSSESESEDGLYVLQDSTTNTWLKIMGSTGGSSSTDTSSVINTDSSTAPTSGNGISVSTEGSNDVIATSVADSTDGTDAGFTAGTYYTSMGLEANASNDGSDSDQELLPYAFISLMSSDTDAKSYIRLYAKGQEAGNWITLHIEDGTLGFSQDDLTFEDEITWSDNEVTLKYGQKVSCSKNVYFYGLVERRFTNLGDTVPAVDNLIFGGTGSRYYDLDIYSEATAPKVYAYADGTSVQVLTEFDKEEITTEVTNTIINNNLVAPEALSEEEILGLFDSSELED